MGISRTISRATFTLGVIDVENGTFVVKVAGTRTSKLLSFIGDVIDTMADIETFSRVAGQESITFVVSDEIAHSEDPKSAITGCFSNLMNEINEYVTRDPRLIETLDEDAIARGIRAGEYAHEERTGLR